MSDREQHRLPWLPLLLGAFVALPILSCLTHELILRNRFNTMADRIQTGIREFRAAARLVCVNGKDLALAPPPPSPSIPWGVRIETTSRRVPRFLFWELAASCPVHGHGYRYEFTLTQERQVFLRPPALRLQWNVPLDPTLQPLFDRAFDGLHYESIPFEY